MQKPMFEMSGNHIDYIPEICYYYNKNLPSSDGATPERRKRRQKAYLEVLTRIHYEGIEDALAPEER